MTVGEDFAPEVGLRIDEKSARRASRGLILFVAGMSAGRLVLRLDNAANGLLCVK